MWGEFMNRTEFFRYIAGEFFTAEEERNIPDRNYVNFEIESTSLSKVIMDKESRKGLRLFLEKEKSDDNWLFLSEELTAMAITMMSNGKVDGEVGTKEIEYIEAMYYSLIEGVFEISSQEEFEIDLIRKIYIEHMDRLRSFLMKVMDMDDFSLN
jgi:hypothetical protein